MIIAQSGLFYWKKQHKRSYELVRHMAKKDDCMITSITPHNSVLSFR